MKDRILVLISLSLLVTIPSIAQTCSSSAFTNTLICTLPQLFGPKGLILPNTNHQAHFQSASQNTFKPLNIAIGQEFSTLPLGSSGSGTSFTLDSEGHPRATEDSLGPILTERATVIGKKAYSLGVAYQYFNFSEIDGLNLRSLPAVLNHQLAAGETAAPATSYENDYITTTNQLHLTLNQTVIYGTIGISNRMDASIEVPIEAVHFRATSAAHIVRTQPCENQSGVNGGGNCYFPLHDTNPPKGYCGEFHWFAQTTTDCPTIFSSADQTFPIVVPKMNAAGIGDVILRGKYEVIKGEKLAGSLGLGIRFPSGDAKNFLGSGAYGVSPFGALTYLARVSPHVRFGYQWNGDSILGGDPTATSSTAGLPAAWLYSAGVDYRVKKHFTLAVDLIGERVSSASRLHLGSTTQFLNDSHDTGAVATIQPSTASYNSDAIAVGAKVRLKGELVLIGNVTSRVNNGGLRASVVPLVGLSYSF